MINNFDPTYLQNEINAGRLTPEEIVRQISNGEGYDLSTANEQDLNNLVGGLNTYGPNADKRPQVDRNQVFQQIGSMLGGADVKGRKKIRPGDKNHPGDTVNVAVAGNLPNIQNLLADFVTQNLRLPDVGEFRDLANSKGLPGQDYIAEESLANFLNNQDNKNYVAKTLVGDPTDYTGQLSNIQQVLSGKVDTRQRQESLDSTVNSLPALLAGNTNSEIQSLYDNATGSLQEELSPSIMQNLNVRGLLSGGDLQAELTSAGANLYGDIQNTHEQLLAQDDAFFKDAAFRNELQKASQTAGDYNQALTQQRDTALSESQRRFQASQTDINNRFQEDLTSRQAQASYYQQQEKARKLRDAQDSASTNQILGNIGSAVGTTVGAAYGGPIGAAAGGAAGRSLGGISTGR